MVRNNEERFGPRNSGGDEAIISNSANLMDFVTPTEFVDLPSKGKGYPPGHPLHMQETIEIKYMTAKHEDILTSRSLLKKGLAMDRLIDSLIVDKNINSKTLLVGDRNAIIISARSSGYGHMYDTSVTCPACGEKAKHRFDLTEPKVHHGDDWGDYDVSSVENGNFLITLPRTGFKVEVKLLRGEDEMKIFKLMQNVKNEHSVVTKQMRMYIVSVEGNSQPQVIKHFVENIPMSQTKYLRDAYACISPSLRIVADFECESCGHEQELEVSLGTDFFWPDQ